jgi:hypothetical protein
MSVSLGQLEKMDLRKAWESEASHFTPWLAEPQSIRLLSEAVGIDLEVEALEKDVGPFRADILCKDTATGTRVLIENQLERTDHTHLGQLMTYAAGLDAVTIVWLSPKFTPEHRAALDWLNRITDDRINFFGLEIELWRIGDSPMAPKFNVISQPNDWSKSVMEAANRLEMSSTEKLQLEFWKAFCLFKNEHGGRVRPTKPLAQNWMGFALGRSGFRLSGVISLRGSEAETYECGELRAEMYMEGPDSKQYLSLLERDKSEIEADLGESLLWHSKGCKVYVRKPADIHTRGEWPSMFEWLNQELEALYRVFAPRVRALTLPPDPSEEVGSGGVAELNRPTP